MSNRVSVFRKEHFNAAHRLYRPDWDDATNDRVFGKCALPNFHGHNYELIVKVTGEIDPETGYVIDLKLLSDLIHQEVIEKLQATVNLRCFCESKIELLVRYKNFVNMNADFLAKL